MPEPRTMRRATEKKRRGRSPSTQAGEFVREEIHHVREGVHGARSTKQAIAIGLSKARRAGVDLPPPKQGTASLEARRHAEHDAEVGHAGRHEKSRSRSRATFRALQREGTEAASSGALSRQARKAAQRRPVSARSAAARKGARTKSRSERSAAARKGARTRARAS
jgi:Family of unknown function (DUF6496)